jgi:hypothetical protein
LSLTSERAQFSLKPLGGDKRAFCPVPGFEFLPFYAPFDREILADISLEK